MGKGEKKMDFRNIVGEELYEAKGKIDLGKLVKVFRKSEENINKSVWNEIDGWIKEIQTMARKAGIDLTIIETQWDAFSINSKIFLIAKLIYIADDEEKLKDAITGANSFIRFDEDGSFEIKIRIT